MNAHRPAWVEISASAIKDNVRAIAAHVGRRTRVCAVVKAKAYGHGAVTAARAALEGGASCLAVALAEEGAELREAGIAAPIILLGAPRFEEIEDILAAGLEATVFDEGIVRAFDKAAGARGDKARLHLKIDTGMTRIGCRPEATPALAALIGGLPHLTLAGVYSHFADADDPESGFAREQLARFKTTVAALGRPGPASPTLHMANSAATFWLPESRLDLVRVGIAMYGLRPTLRREPPLAELRPALSLKAKVTRIHEVEAGASVSYGRTWIAGRRSRIATVPLGYADGYPRVVSGRCWAGFAGARLPQVGTVCMDMCMFDATDCPELGEGDTLIMAGPGGPSLDEIATLAGTINYELACHAGLRLPHLAKEGDPP